MLSFFIKIFQQNPNLAWNFWSDDDENFGGENDLHVLSSN